MSAHDERVFRRARDLCAQVIVQSRSLQPPPASALVNRAFNLCVPLANLGAQPALDASITKPLFVSIVFAERPASPSDSSSAAAVKHTVLERWRIAFERGLGDPVEPSVVAQGIAVLLRVLFCQVRALPCQALVFALRRNRTSRGSLLFRMDNKGDEFLLEEYAQLAVGKVPTQYGTLWASALVKRDLSAELAVAGESLISSRLIVEDYVAAAVAGTPGSSTVAAATPSTSPLTSKIAAFVSAPPLGSAPIPIAAARGGQGSTSVEPSPAFAIRGQSGGSAAASAATAPGFAGIVGATPPFSYHSFQPASQLSLKLQHSSLTRQQGSAEVLPPVPSKQQQQQLPPLQSATVTRVPLLSYYTPFAADSTSPDPSSGAVGGSSQFASGQTTTADEQTDTARGSPDSDDGMHWMPMPFEDGDDEEEEPAFAVPPPAVQAVTAAASGGALADADDFLRMCVDPPALELFSARPSVTVDELSSRYNSAELARIFPAAD